MKKNKKIALMLLGALTANCTFSQVDSQTARADGDIFYHNALTYCKYNMSKDVYCKESAVFFDEALPYYLEALKLAPDDADLNFRIGVCYYTNNNADKAIPYFDKAISINPNVDVQIDFYEALCQKQCYNWNSAIEKFSTMIEKQRNGSIPKKHAIDEAVLQQHIAECRRADSLSKNPLPIEIKNMGENVNSKYDDYCIVSSESGSSVMFTARKPDFRLLQPDEDSLDFEINIDNTFENIYVSYQKGSGWSKARRLNNLIVAEGEHYAMLDISDNGRECLLYRSDNGGDIYKGVFDNGDWSGISKIDNINTNSYEPTAIYASDGIYLISSRSGGKGGKDIYFAQKNADGTYSKPENLGDVINTSGDEDGLCLVQDSILFFGSNGHQGLGGYDIYKSVKNNGHWSKPELLPFPINTPYNDVFFNLNESAYNHLFANVDDDKFAWAYITSDRQGSFGRLDIFQVKLDVENPIAIACVDADKKVSAPTLQNNSETISTLVGRVFDAESKKNIVANIVVTSNGKSLYDFDANENGEFSFNIEKSKSYEISISANGYTKTTDTIFLEELSEIYKYEKPLRSHKTMEVAQLKREYANAGPATAVYNSTIVDYYNGNVVKNVRAKLCDTMHNVMNEIVAENGNFEFVVKSNEVYHIITEADGYNYQTHTIAPLAGQTLIETECLYKSGLGNGVVNSQSATEPYVRTVLFYGDLHEYLYENKKVVGNIDVYGLEDSVAMFTVKTDKNGRFEMFLPADKYFRMVVNADEYMQQNIFINSINNTDKEYLNVNMLPCGDAFVKNNLEEMLASRQLITYSLLQLNLIDQISKQPIDGDITIYEVADSANNNIVGKSSDGKFSVPVENEKLYAISISAENYVSINSEFVNIPKSNVVGLVNLELLPTAATIATAATATVANINKSISDLNFKNVLFNSSRFDVNSEFADDLKNLAKQLVANPNFVVTITGHADATGSESLNMRLSENRARSVAKFLKKQGVAESQIKIVAKGESEPIASNDTEEGKRLNRRVELNVTTK